MLSLIFTKAIPKRRSIRYLNVLNNQTTIKTCFNSLIYLLFVVIKQMIKWTVWKSLLLNQWKRMHTPFFADGGMSLTTWHIWPFSIPWKHCNTFFRSRHLSIRLLCEEKSFCSNLVRLFFISPNRGNRTYKILQFFDRSRIVIQSSDNIIYIWLFYLSIYLFI